MKILIFITCLALGNVTAVASNNYLDSLNSLLLSSEDIIEKGRINYLAARHLKNTSPRQARVYALNSIINFKKAHDLRRLGKSHYLSGEIDHIVSNTKSAAKHFHYSLHYFEQVNDSVNLAKAYIAMAVQYRNASNWESTYEYLQKAKLLIPHNALSPEAALLYRYEAEYYRAKEQPETALELYNKAILIDEASHDLKYLLLTATLENKEYQKAEALITELEQSFKGLPTYLFRLELEKVFLAEYQHKLSTAQQLLAQLEGQLPEEAELQASFWFRKMVVYQKTGNQPVALSSAQALLTLCQQYHLHNYVLNLSETFIEVFKQAGRQDLVGQSHQAYKLAVQESEKPQLQAQAHSQQQLKDAAKEYETELQVATLHTQYKRQLLNQQLAWGIPVGVIVLLLLVLCIRHRKFVHYGIGTYLRYGKKYYPAIKSAHGHFSKSMQTMVAVKNAHAFEQDQRRKGVFDNTEEGEEEGQHN